MQPRTTIHNHPQTIHNYPETSTIIYNRPQQLKIYTNKPKFVANIYVTAL